MKDNNEKMQYYFKYTEKVLENYDICYDSIDFLQESENVTFCISNSMKEEKFLVRIHKSINSKDNYQDDKNMVNSEMLLLDELKNCVDIEVQVPVRNKMDSFVTTQYDELLEKDLNITILKWINGTTIDINEEKHIELISHLGEKLAQFHNCLEEIEMPKEFKRQEYDLESSRRNLKELEELSHLSIIKQSQYDYINNHVRDIIDYIDQNLSTKSEWGIIHSDLNEGNYIFNGDELSFIDFSRCGYGYFVADIAQTLMHIMPQKHSLLIEGYSKQRSLPDHYEKLTECFFALSIIENIVFLLSNAEEYDHIGKMAGYLQEHVLNKISRNERFLF